MSFWIQSARLTGRLLAQRGVQAVSNDFNRSIKRWIGPTLREIVKRKKKQEAQPEAPRSSYLEWNYEIEVRCFGKRLGETFDQSVLKEAFVQREWANLQEFNAKGDESFVPFQHNYELAQDGAKLIEKYVKENYAALYPEDVANAITAYLTTDEMLAHIAKYLGMKDLIISKEYPPETETMADAFRAVVGALSISSADDERVKKFVKDFVICQMNGKDIYDVWVPEKPYDYLLGVLKSKGVEEIEPRLCNESASNTILANYEVGLYNVKDKSCLGLGWGESIQVAQDTAALDAIQRIYMK